MTKIELMGMFLDSFSIGILFLWLLKNLQLYKYLLYVYDDDDSNVSYDVYLT